MPSASRALSIHARPSDWAMLFLFYFLVHFTATFFDVALVACVRERFAGRRHTVVSGIGFAGARVGLVFLGALLSATVGALLGLLRHVSHAGRGIFRTPGNAWSSIGALAMPVFVYERLGPFAALRRAVQILRHTWAEVVIADLGAELAFQVLS